MCAHRQRGFSLLELLVTLFIIVMVTSLVSLNVGSGGRDIELQSIVEDVADTAQYALDEAQFAGWDYGLLISVEDDRGEWHYRYEWLERGPNAWRKPVEARDVFAGGQFPPDIELQLELEDVIQDQEVLTNLPEQPEPQIVLYASGETLPGALEIRSKSSGDVLWRVEWNLLGNFRTLLRGEPGKEP